MSRARSLKRLTLCACLAALALPGAVAADHGPSFSDPAVDRYLQIAQRHWGGAFPVCGGPAGEPIPVHAVLFEDPDPDVTAAAEQPGCRIWLDRDFWPARASRIDCTVMVHEFGHLLGFGHSPSYRHVMFATPTSGAPACDFVAPRAAGPKLQIGSAIRASGRAGRSARTRRPRRARPRATDSRLRRGRRAGPGRIAIDRR